MNKTVLVTGATGFIGSHVAEALADRGYRCVALVRDPSRLCPELVGRVETRIGDIRDKESLIHASRGCSSIVHVAGLSSDWGAYADFYETNVTGTLNVLDACSHNRIGQAIITGSISSYGEENSGIIKNETFPFNSHYPYFLDSLLPCRMNWYRDTKAEATQKAMAMARSCGIDCTVIEPVFVYGEREFSSGFYTYAKSVKGGMRFMPGSKINLFHLIYAADCARAYVLALEKKLGGVERILIGNPEPQPMHRIFSLFCAEAGVAPPRMLPKWVFYVPALVLEIAATLMRSRTPPLLTRGRVNMFYDSIGYSIQKAQELLDFSCEYTLEQGIRKTVRWYRDKGYL
ncbi:MAG: NAD-dependent epimerase/dehydratase family protein [Chitinispirillaceae bacterium]|nr:NAD-dependent epimerase/dehydratase family protein [Chitinispirillaceae bacterium]